jgi:hypothetical protein
LASEANVLPAPRENGDFVVVVNQARSPFTLAELATQESGERLRAEGRACYRC